VRARGGEGTLSSEDISATRDLFKKAPVAYLSLIHCCLNNLKAQINKREGEGEGEERERKEERRDREKYLSSLGIGLLLSAGMLVSHILFALKFPTALIYYKSKS
jgi:hypothetical protein